MATDFWPNPRLFGTVPDPGIWFTLGSPNEVQCMAEGLVGGGGETKKLVPATTAADARVMDGSYQPVRGYAAGQWEAQLRLYRRLYASPELRPDGSAEADWYDAQSNSPLEHLGNTYQGILALSQYTAEEQSSLAAAAAAAKAATDAIVENNEAIATALENEEPVEELLGTQGELDAVLASATDAYTAVLSNAHNIRLAQAQELLAQVEAAGATEPYEQDFKTVCQILLETYSGENGVSAENREVLTAIAHQCRYAGGFAVLQARASLDSEWDFTAYDDCPEAIEPRSIQPASATAFGLYPNPAHDATVLQLGYTATTGRAILRDLNGRTVGEWPLDGQKLVQLQWKTQLPAGLYLLEVVTDQKPPQVLKLVVEKH